jgi:hypothetical protein
MADMVVVGYRMQALALPHHADGFALLVRSQLWLGPEFHASFLGGDTPPIGRRSSWRSHTGARPSANP